MTQRLFKDNTALKKSVSDEVGGRCRRCCQGGWSELTSTEDVLFPKNQIPACFSFLPRLSNALPAGAFSHVRLKVAFISDGR